MSRSWLRFSTLAHPNTSFRAPFQTRCGDDVERALRELISDLWRPAGILLRRNRAIRRFSDDLRSGFTHL